MSTVSKKQVVKDIILQLHKGLSVMEAKQRFENECGAITSSEIAEIEQSLINDGLSPDEIKKFCNVHALLFQSALEKTLAKETSPSHPVHLFKLENREIEKLLKTLKDAVSRRTTTDLLAFKRGVKDVLVTLRGVETHYERKEQVLFPFLEKQGFMGPSKVMWGKDNEVRDLLKAAISGIDAITGDADFKSFEEKTLNVLIEEVEGMVFKEENILFPTCLEKLPASDWVEVLKASDEVGYAYIEKPKETEVLIRELNEALVEEPVIQDNAVAFPSGSVSLSELMCLLNTLPVDLTFVDREDRVKYFTEGKARIFTRPRAVIGRAVQNCHPPQSLDVVQKIVTAFKDGTKDFFEFWINFRGRLVHIRYFAVRDRERRYLGTLEMSQDITDIKKLEGERRLLSERD
ncbi:MAG: DUF438 domain-containing protein [Chloroflexi bacterium]|nr:DUF438 domain-containing protein [Chloroflexota bacterium]